MRAVGGAAPWDAPHQSAARNRQSWRQQCYTACTRMPAQSVEDRAARAITAMQPGMQPPVRDPRQAGARHLLRRQLRRLLPWRGGRDRGTARPEKMRSTSMGNTGIAAHPLAM